MAWGTGHPADQAASQLIENRTFVEQVSANQKVAWGTGHPGDNVRGTSVDQSKVAWGHGQR